MWLLTANCPGSDVLISRIPKSIGYRLLRKHSLNSMDHTVRVSNMTKYWHILQFPCTSFLQQHSLGPDWMGFDCIDRWCFWVNPTQLEYAFQNWRWKFQKLCSKVLGTWRHILCSKRGWWKKDGIGIFSYYRTKAIYTPTSLPLSCYR